VAVNIETAYLGLNATKLVNIVERIPYAEWAVAEGVPSDQSEPSDTPLNDGIPNLLKFACGLSAMVSCTTSDLMSIDQGKAGSAFAISYRESKSADVKLEAIWVESLSDPSWTTEGVTNTIIGQDLEYVLKKASIPAGSRGFMRLQATPVESEPILE